MHAVTRRLNRGAGSPRYCRTCPPGGCQGGAVEQAVFDAVHLPGVVEAARHLTHATQLSLSATLDYYDEKEGMHDVGAELAARPFSLAPLAPRLLRLSLGVDGIRPATCTPLRELTALTSLTVGVFDAQVPPELWAAVGYLTQLGQLAIKVHTQEGKGHAASAPRRGWRWAPAPSSRS